VYLRNIFAAVFKKPNLKMKTKVLLTAFLLLSSLSNWAQTQLQYQLNQQGGGSCAGSQVELSVSTAVRLSTNDASEITVNTAISGGNVTNDGGNAVSQRGVCWNTSPNPTTANFTTSDGSGLGNFSSNLTGLSPNTTYYIRAYAINSAGTFYGNEVSFITGNAANPTAHSCGAENVHNPNLIYGSMTDQEGNVYKTIVIGEQEWMAENLHTSTYKNGDLIPNATDGNQWFNLTTGAWCFYNNDPQFECPYGKLYNWYAVADSRNVCPTGWHVPSDAEWTTLTNFLAGESVAGGKMKSAGTQYWLSPNIAADNSSGFSGLPGGTRYGNGDGFLDIGYFGYWWSSTEYNTNDAWGRDLYYDGGSSSRYIDNKRDGFSVRCLRTTDSQQGSINNLDCGSANNSGTLTQGTAASGVSSIVPYTGGNGGTYDGQTINSSGVIGLTATLEAGTFDTGAGSLTYSITGTPSTSGTASFTLNIGGQTCTLQIPVISNQPLSTHTCGSENVHNPNLSYGSMTDQEGNVYKTIVIGEQEWMAENLNTSTYRNGDSIPTNITNGFEWGNLTTGAWCYYNNDAQFECPYGKLYNWYTVADPRNVCPAGWHVPTDAEWTTVTNFLGGQPVAGGKMKSTGTQYWLSPNTSGSNESGFSGLPGGTRSSNNDGYFLSVGANGYWWSSTEFGTFNAWFRALNYSSGGAGRGTSPKRNGFSVRCLRD
jgi:uncharacterized protein (TIGR02145 family)